MTEDRETLNPSNEQRELGLREIENARVGYQVAAHLRTSRAAELWSQFGVFMTANSILLAAATLIAGSGQVALVLTKGIPAVGLILCCLWLVLHARGVSYIRYYLLSARELEERFLSDQVKTLSRGSQYATGRNTELTLNGSSRVIRIDFLGRILPVRWIAHAIVLLFMLMYLALLIFGFG
jgi:hypothetical protein